MERRQFLEAAGALLGVSAAWRAESPPPLPDPKLRQRDPEQYWKRIREEQFLLPNWRAFLNNGSLGVAPKLVVKAVADYLASSAALEMDYYPRWGYETLDEFRQELAAFFGCRKDELAITHNATEAMSMIAAGLDLKPGDEIVITDQEHPSGRGCWQMKAARHGLTLREIPIPLPPESPEQLAELLIRSLGPKTRVLSFSGITSPTGLVMPVREICTAARAKGVITVVDGAHMHGQIDFRISDLNCDYLAGSPHKWMFAPAGSGLLYIREENLEKLWPTIISGGWNETKLKAARFMNVGTNNRAIVEGMMAGLRFYQQLGPEAVRDRMHQLARYLRSRAAECPHVELLTPEDDRMYAALVTIRFKQDDLKKFHELLQAKRVWCFQSKQVRLAVHVHTRPQDIDLYFDLLREALG
ncbi:MAG: aminotransferase class V-fold PLP-dependent enzyme [Bryobacteraceae bacterium]|nr:aminotransferase class V-fold PLP-dependent enzyme [Bryobacteraceae bacterium]MDW8378717.1 aminotransferase class V-fold PLP-dependent enzyme [Bryobacterales bacterium]